MFWMSFAISLLYSGENWNFLQILCLNFIAIFWKYMIQPIFISKFYKTWRATWNRIACHFGHACHRFATAVLNRYTCSCIPGFNWTLCQRSETFFSYSLKKWRTVFVIQFFWSVEAGTFVYVKIVCQHNRKINKIKKQVLKWEKCNETHKRKEIKISGPPIFNTLWTRGGKYTPRPTFCCITPEP